MMSITSVSGSAGASSYYEVDDYYNEGNKEQHTELSEWHGKGATLLNLKGPVKGDDFRAILDGNLPNGQSLGRWMKGGGVESPTSEKGNKSQANKDIVVETNERGDKRVHRAGMDLTFSPPKSVAIMAQVFGDKRIIDAHKEAVKETLDLIERTAAKARVSRAGITQDEKTGNLAIATFFHTATRNQDPGMHTHAVVANATLCEDGKWRSLDNSEIWIDSKAKYGEYYSMSLAYKLQKSLGYEIHAKGKNAEYEIAGVPQKIIDHFSTRSQDMKALLDELKLVGPKAKEWANLHTRAGKTNFDKALETEAWKERAEAQGFNLSGLISESKQRLLSMEQGQDKGSIALSAVKDAAEAISQRQSTFTRKELIQEARNFSVGYAQDRELGLTVRDLEKNEYLLSPGKDKGILTTKETVALENDNLLRIRMGKGEFDSIGQHSNLDSLSRTFTLNRSQDEALRVIANSHDRYVGFQGWAGVGKTHWAKPFKEVVENAGYLPVGLSASAQAAKGLEKGSGIPSQTLASFLHENRELLDSQKSAESQKQNAHAINQGEKQRPFLVVDESSFISTKDMNKLLKVAEGLDARVLFMGDYKQLEGVDSGRPYSQMLANKLEHGRSKDIVRQKDVDLRSAVYKAITGNIKDAMDNVNVSESPVAQEYYREAENSKSSGIKVDIDYRAMRQEIRQDLIVQAAGLFLGLTQEEREKTLLVAPTNEIREGINNIVRDSYVKEGRISQEGITVDAFKGKGLTDGSMRYAHNYDVGNVVRFNTPSKYHGIARGEYYTVTHNAMVMEGERYLELSNRDDPNKNILIHPRELASRGQGAVEVFETRTRELAEGDTIRWTRNDKPNDLINTESATILELNKESGVALMELSSGDIKEIDLSDSKNRHFDYNIALTTHAAQGATYDKVIAVAESYSGFMTTQQSFYVQISRARFDATIVTDDKDKLVNALSGNDGYEATALSLYAGQDMPLDFTLLDSLNEQLGDNYDLKEVYNNALVSLGGDIAATHEHLQAIGVDAAVIERDIMVDVADEQFTAQPEHNTELNDTNTQALDVNNGHDLSTLTDEANQSIDTSYDIGYLEMAQDIESHKIIEMHEAGELSFQEAVSHLSELGVDAKTAEELLTTTQDTGYFETDEMTLSGASGEDLDSGAFDPDIEWKDGVGSTGPYDGGIDLDDW